MTKWLKSYPWIVPAIVLFIATASVAVVNRNVYTKPEVDAKIAVEHEYNAVVNSHQQRQVDHIEQDVRWLVRNLGGTPSVEARTDSSTSQPDGR